MESENNENMSPCFICSSKLSPTRRSRPTPKRVKPSSDSVEFESDRHKIFMQYLLQTNGDAQKANQIYNDMVSLSTSAQGSESLIRFCETCQKFSEEITSLQVELDMIDMKITDKLNIVRRIIIENSMYGSNDHAKRSFVKLEKKLEQDKKGFKNKRKLLDLVRDFQTFVYEKGDDDFQIQRMLVPMVFQQDALSPEDPEAKRRNFETDPTSDEYSLRYRNHVKLEPTSPSSSVDFNDDEDEEHFNLEDNSFNPEPETETQASKDDTNVSEAKRRKYSIDFKLEVINYAKGKSIAATCRHFKIHKKQVSNWIKQKDQFVLLKNQGSNKTRITGGGKKVISEDLEKQLLEWIQEQTNQEIHVSHRQIQKKALEIFPTLTDNRGSTFSASKGWVYQFLDRHKPFNRQGRTLKLDDQPEPVNCCDEQLIDNQDVSLNEDLDIRNSETDPDPTIDDTVPDLDELIDDIDDNIESPEIQPKKNVPTKKRTYDLNFKLMVAEHASTHSIRETGRKFKIHDKQVRNWSKQKDTLSELISQGINKSRLFGGGSKIFSKELEQRLTAWVQEQIIHQVKLSRKHVQLKALDIFASVTDCRKATFNASQGWVANFLTRNNLVYRPGKGIEIQHNAGEQSGSAKVKVNRVECEICGEMVLSKSKLIRHKIDQHNFPKLRCQICPNKEFYTEGTLTQHMNVCHGDPIESNGVCTCEVCGFLCLTRRELQQHQLSHSDVKNFVCDTCGFCTKTKGSLERHRGTVHLNDDLKRYKCPYCEKGFSEFKTLADHVRRHTGERPYKCQTCEASFTQMGALNMHKRKHDRQKNSFSYNTSYT